MCKSCGRTRARHRPRLIGVLPKANLNRKMTNTRTQYGFVVSQPKHSPSHPLLTYVIPSHTYILWVFMEDQHAVTGIIFGTARCSPARASSGQTHMWDIPQSGLDSLAYSMQAKNMPRSLPRIMFTVPHSEPPSDRNEKRWGHALLACMAASRWERRGLASLRERPWGRVQF